MQYPPRGDGARGRGGEKTRPHSPRLLRSFAPSPFPPSGPRTSEADSFAIMDRALELGINFFDTANVYGGQFGEGLAEQIVEQWFAQGGGRREKVVLATKVYNRMGDWPNQSRLSALHIQQACDASLKRLKTDWIDLYQMHHVDRETPFEEIWEAFARLMQQGKVLYVGSSKGQLTAHSSRLTARTLEAVSREL